MDSFIEVSSALVVIWQFRSRLPEARERVALRLIAVSFFALAAWISIDSVRHLLGVEHARVCPVGIGVAAVSVIVMPLLVWAKRRTGRELGSATVVADSVQTLLCTYLSAMLLVGLLLNWAFGWSWADPLAALLIAGVAAKEGVQAWRGEQCDDCALPAIGDSSAAPANWISPTPVVAATGHERRTVADSDGQSLVAAALLDDVAARPAGAGSGSHLVWTTSRMTVGVGLSKRFGRIPAVWCSRGGIAARTGQARPGLWRERGWRGRRSCRPGCPLPARGSRTSVGAHRLAWRWGFGQHS